MTEQYVDSSSSLPNYNLLRLFEDVFEAFCPQAVVVQCGGDCLAGDPIGRFNLSIGGVERCVRYVLGKGGFT